MPPDPQALFARIRATGGDPDRLVVVATEVLEEAELTGADSGVIASLLDVRADAHLLARSGRRDVHLADALADCQQALGRTAEDDPLRVGRMVRTAVVMGEQVDGDRRARAQSAEKLLRDALAGVHEQSDPALVALIRTNLALALQVQARDDDIRLLQEARELCDAALAYRSPERNVEDWAFSVINLGVILGRLAKAGEANPADARDAYESVVARAAVLPPAIVAHARVNLLNVIFDAITHDDAELNALREQRARLEAAAGLSREIASTPGASTVSRGRALRRLGVLVEQLGDFVSARAALGEAVRLLDGTDLKELQLAAWRLASLEVQQGQWEAAAVAYRAALRATDLLVGAPWEARDRMAEIAASSRLPRWAARAFAEVGAPEEAVLALENGRARELRRQLQFEDPKLKELEALAPEAVLKWRTAAAALTEPSADEEVARRDFQDALGEIRRCPGFEEFGTVTDLDGIRAAATDRAPVLYIDPTPTGTVVFRVDASGEIGYRLLPVTSQDIVLRVQFGFDPRFEPMPDEFLSYIAAAAGNTADMEDGRALPDIGPALDCLLPWIGEHVASHIDDMLSSSGDREALLVVSGPLATVPLSAAALNDRGRCLLDAFVISTTPCATAHAAARRRASATRDVFSSFVSIADPTGDLRFTRTEVEQLAPLFSNVITAEGALATRDWVRTHAKRGSVLHFACHAFGGMLDATRSGFVLADGHLSGREVARLGPLEARLAVASACQSGVIGIGDLADEAFSLGSALLGAGAACAIASLWPVDDMATAMLMVKLYDEISHGQAPPAALAEAQRWLRDLTQAERWSFLLRNPRLAEYDRKRRPGDRHEDMRLERTDRPYRHPRYWAAFVALGA